jgi:hypothetical protein
VLGIGANMLWRWRVRRSTRCSRIGLERVQPAAFLSEELGDAAAHPTTLGKRSGVLHGARLLREHGATS